jgi:hypothetical protein
MGYPGAMHLPQESQCADTLPHVPNQPKTPNRVVRIDDQVWRDLGAAADDAGTTRSDLIRQLVNWYLRYPKAKRPDRPVRG